MGVGDQLSTLVQTGAMCWAARACGRICGYARGWANEFMNLVDSVAGGPGGFSWDDIVANHKGVLCSFIRDDCHLCCSARGPRR